MKDSIEFSLQNIAESIEGIAENTKLLYISDIDSNITYVSFIISLLALIAGIIAAFYSWQGYIYQKASSDKLDELVPGQISLYEILGGLLNTILDLEAIYFGDKKYKEYPIKLILSMSTLPDDFIELRKYEKNKGCYDAAVSLKMAWRNYNVFLNTLIDNSINDNMKEEDILSFANYVMSYTKYHIIYLQRFEKIMLEQKYIKTATASSKDVSNYLLELFFEYAQIIKKYGIEEIDTSRKNLTNDTLHEYIKCEYMPDNIDVESYLSGEHYNRLSAVKEWNENILEYDVRNVYNQIKNNEFKMIDSLYKKEKRIADMDLENFKTSYFTYIEPIILGCKRLEYSRIKQK